MRYADDRHPAARAGAWGTAPADTRDRFLVRTYNHLFGAIVLFALIEVALFQTGLAYGIARAMLGTSWLLVIGAFMVVSWFATSAVQRAESKAAQYGALFAFVLAEAIVFVPLLVIAEAYAPGAIQSAGLVTILGFAGLTGIAFWTKKDFSFLGGVLRWAGILSIVAVIAALVFDFSLGTWFSVAMVGFAGGAILYETSSIMRDYPEDRHVAAALQLFSSVALLFWYVLRIFISRER